MAEKLLTTKEVAARLSMSTRTFWRNKHKYIARGLQVVNIGAFPKYREASLDRLIQKLADNGGKL